MIGVALAAGAAAGLASVPHCAGMCGPLAVYAGAQGRGMRAALGYHGGRLAAYAALGAVAGAGGGLIGDALPERWGSALLTWSLAVALAALAWRCWRTPERAAAPPLVTLGRERARPSSSERLFALAPKNPLVLGALTGLLPCGALYAALLLAASSGGPFAGALSMLAFGVVSSAGLVVVSAMATRLRGLVAKSTTASRLLATALLVGAIVLAVRPIASLSSDAPAPACAACHTVETP